MPQIIFLTVYLGLISGRQPIELQADSAIRSIRLTLDGAVVETMDKPPWHTTVDFGALQPREIVAIGLDEHGQEIARAAQFLNIPKPHAEVEIAVEKNRRGVPERATIVPSHVGYADIKHASLKMDGKRVSLDEKYVAILPAADIKRPHYLTAEVRFDDGTVANKETVFGGEFGESMPSQLTPVAIERTGSSDAVPADGCVSGDGAALRVTAVEKPNPLVIVVRDPDPEPLAGALAYSTVWHGEIDTNYIRHAAALEDDATMQLLLPVSKRAISVAQPTAFLFSIGPAVDAARGGLFRFITTVKLRSADSPDHRWADAVAVAGVQAVASGRRRAVILILGKESDVSLYTPPVVRKYLDVLGVPLFVWSVAGPRPDLGGAWGNIVDVSTIQKMDAAGAEIRKMLDAQRIAWIDADPLTALRATVKEGCGYVSKHPGN